MFRPLSVCSWRRPHTPRQSHAQFCSLWFSLQGNQFGVRWALTAVTPRCASPLKQDSIGRGPGRSQSPRGILIFREGGLEATHHRKRLPNVGPQDPVYLPVPVIFVTDGPGDSFIPHAALVIVDRALIMALRTRSHSDSSFTLNPDVRCLTSLICP